MINYLVNDKDVKKQDDNDENSDEEILKTPENNNKKQPDLSISLVKQQQENDNKEKIEDLLERIEEIFETGGEAGEETKKRYKCPICSSTFSHRRYFFFGFFFKSPEDLKSKMNSNSGPEQGSKLPIL